MSTFPSIPGVKEVLRWRDQPSGEEHRLLEVLDPDGYSALAMTDELFESDAELVEAYFPDETGETLYAVQTQGCNEITPVPDFVARRLFELTNRPPVTRKPNGVKIEGPQSYLHSSCR